MKERLLKYLRYRKMGQNSFEDMCGLASGVINKLNLGFRSDKLALIAEKCPDLNIRWLITGEGDMLMDSYPYKEPDGIDLPLLPFSAVAGYLAENNSESWSGLEYCRVPEFSSRGADFLIRVEGDSMYPRYGNGELLAIRVIKDPTFFQWGKVYVLSTNQGCVVKRLFPDPKDDRAIVCHSENSSLYPDYRITKEDVLGVAIVVGHIGVE